MAALRWILLLAGMLFLAGLSWWELRRPRQASRDAQLRPEHREPPLGDSALTASRPMAVPPMLGTPDEALPLVVEPPVVQPPTLHASAAGAPAEYDAPRDIPEQPLPHEADAAPELVVEFPPESERRILNLRLLPPGAERFSGRAVRQSLLASGFVYGRFGIFHQPHVDGRAILSAASLSRPGLLDPENMDFQRFLGLSLFAVLPGALPASATLERLLDAAHDLAQRLGARVQDEHGVALDAASIEAWRRELGAGPPTSELSAEPAA